MTSMHECFGWGVVAATAFVLGLGCGGNGGSPEAACGGKDCERTSVAADGGTGGDDGAPTVDAGPSDASSVWDSVLTGDGALADSGLFGGPLEVAIDIQGQDRACGSCAVLLADIRGGMPPYEVTWSDSSLEGYGPHEVCTDESVEYTLQVTDSGPDGEFAERQMAEATATAACEERSEGAGLTGCRVLTEGSVFTALEGGPTEAQLERQYGCEALDGSEGIPGSELYEASMETDAGPPTLEASGLRIPEGGFRAGQSYQLSLDLLFGIQLGGDVRAEIWGSEVGCSKDEKLGELRLRSEDLGHSAFCFTPEHDFEKIVLVVGDDSINPLFGFSLGVSFSACNRCE